MRNLTHEGCTTWNQKYSGICLNNLIVSKNLRIRLRKKLTAFQTFIGIPLYLSFQVYFKKLNDCILKCV
jgi:hypothetical protein